MVTGCPTLERKMPVQPEGLSCLGSETVLRDLHQARSWGADPCLVSGLGARNLTHSVDCTAENWAAVAGLLSFQHFALVGWRTVLRNSTCLPDVTYSHMEGRRLKPLAGPGDILSSFWCSGTCKQNYLFKNSLSHIRSWKSTANSARWLESCDTWWPDAFPQTLVNPWGRAVGRDVCRKDPTCKTTAWPVPRHPSRCTWPLCPQRAICWV